MKLYKDLSKWYNIVVITGMLGIVLIFGLLSRMYLSGAAGISIAISEALIMLVCLIVLLVWGIGCTSFFNILANKRLTILEQVRMEACKIEDYADAWEWFWNPQLFPVSQDGTKYEQIIKLHLSSAYLDLGETEKSLELLQSMSVVFKNSAGGTNYKMMYYNNLATTYLRLHNVEQAEAMLEQMKECMEHSRISKANRDMYEGVYQMKKVLLAMEQGNYEGAESFFRENIRKEGSKLTKVYNHYCLADVYRHFGNEEEERDCLTFVADNGGDSMYAREAGRRLEFLKLQ